MISRSRLSLICLLSLLLAMTNNGYPGSLKLSHQTKALMKGMFIFTILVLTTLSFATCNALSVNPTQTNTNDLAEEAGVRSLVEGFGKRLATVSLQSPNAAEEMKQQYAQYVSPTLLEGWMANPLSAPGRMVSSPWPDRIEITSLTKEGADRYIVHALVIEVTSMEVVKRGVAAEIPVVIELQKNQGHWVITGYTVERH